MNCCYFFVLFIVVLCVVLLLYVVEFVLDFVDCLLIELVVVCVQVCQLVVDIVQFISFGVGDWKSILVLVMWLDWMQIECCYLCILFEIVIQDVLLGDSYVLVGYYQNIVICGFVLDIVIGYWFNGLFIVGEQWLVLENVQMVEIFKGEVGFVVGVMLLGGIINYVGKCVVDVCMVIFGIDVEGLCYVVVDVGQWLMLCFGVWVNVVWEDIVFYIDYVDGCCNFYLVVVDWLIGECGKFEVDVNYQISVQCLVFGYQLFGVMVLLCGVDWLCMLGYQVWQQLVGIDSINIIVLYIYDFSLDWQLCVLVSYSCMVIDDNVVFVYGCYYVVFCVDGSVLGNYFGLDGVYDIYDYCSLDDICCNQVVCVELCGILWIGCVEYVLIFGVEIFWCMVDKCCNVNEYVGMVNVNDVQVLQFVLLFWQLGVLVCCLDSWQNVVFVLDWMCFGDDWEWLVGGCFVCFNECVYSKVGVFECYSWLLCFLLQIVLVWKVIDEVSVYVSYVCGIVLGQEVFFWISNDGIFFVLMLLCQVEVGVKFVFVDVLIFGVVLFCIIQFYQYVMLDWSDVGFIFVQLGQQVYIGLEFIVQGYLIEWFELNVSVSVLQVCVYDIGIVVYEGYQLVNVFKVCVMVYVDYQVLFVLGLGVIGGWCYVGVNVVMVDGVVCVLVYYVFDVGVCYCYLLCEWLVIWNFMVDNVIDCFYWCDIGSSVGDYYLFVGVLCQVCLLVMFGL